MLMKKNEKFILISNVINIKIFNLTKVINFKSIQKY